MIEMTTERPIEADGSILTDDMTSVTKFLKALDKAIEVMGNRDVIDKLEVRLRSHERAEYHPLSYIRIDEVKDLIEAFKKEKQ